MMKPQQKRHILSWREYERAMFNELYYVFRSPEFLVVPDVRTIRGLLSSTRRQVDVAVYRNNIKLPVLAVECKRYNRPLNIKDIESFLGMMSDLGVRQGVLVAPLGFSRSAEHRAAETTLILQRLTERDAVRLNWRELARSIFSWDEGFHREMGDAFDAMFVDADIQRCIDALWDIPFEEWEVTIQTLLGYKKELAIRMLKTIAVYNPDDGWRFNAIRILMDLGKLDYDFAISLIEQETDPETLELLNEFTDEDF